jgi:hypothetical protein
MLLWIFKRDAIKRQLNNSALLQNKGIKLLFASSNSSDMSDSFKEADLAKCLLQSKHLVVVLGKDTEYFSMALLPLTPV